MVNEIEFKLADLFIENMESNSSLESDSIYKYFLIESRNVEYAVAILHDYFALRVVFVTPEWAPDMSFFYLSGVRTPLFENTVYNIRVYFHASNIPCSVVRYEGGAWKPTCVKHEKNTSAYFYRKDIQIPCKSSWEANIGRILEACCTPYTYESDSFFIHYRQTTGYYIPDFVLDKNKIIEVKGHWGDSDRDKVSGLVTLYPEFDIILIDSDVYSDIAKIWSNKIASWEVSPIKQSTQTLQITHSKNILPESYMFKLLHFEVRSFKTGDRVAVCEESGAVVGYISDSWAVIYIKKIQMGIQYDIVILGYYNSELTASVSRRRGDPNVATSLFQTLTQGAPFHNQKKWSPFGTSGIHRPNGWTDDYIGILIDERSNREREIAELSSIDT